MVPGLVVPKSPNQGFCFKTMYIVYGLIDPRSLEIRYVGKSVKGLKRPKEHGQPSNLDRKHTHTSNWIKELKASGFDYITVVLECTPEDKTLLSEAEIWWIAYGRASGWDLTNHTTGGEGQNGWKPSQETKARISKALKGRPLSPDTRAKLSKARLGHAVSEETRLKISKSKRGYKHTQEAKQRMSDKVRAYLRRREKGF